MTNPKIGQSPQGWDTYWQGAKDSHALTAGGASHPFFLRFWKQTLEESFEGRDQVRLLDIATGSGAVLECLDSLDFSGAKSVSCVDISDAAISGVQERFPEITGIVADARSIPLPSGTFDVVTSQFGIEYAGLAAIDEAVRLLAPGGDLNLLLHIRSGAIYLECSVALDAIRKTRKSEFTERATSFFEAGFAAVKGEDKQRYEQAGLELNPAILAIESLISRYGPGVAGGTVATLYDGVKRIHGRIQYYDPEEVLNWLRKMNEELAAYEERMASMCNAALDDAAFDNQCEKLRKSGFTINCSEPLRVQEGEMPFAWILKATKLR